jgi:lipid II:glycine glycyltransferase (peptidoglycan interpeptide bridge formation enzyme)
MTWVLDLSASEDELLMGMTSLNRRVWRRRGEFGLSFEEDSSAKGQKEFAKFIEIISKRTNTIPRSPEYMATLLETFGQDKSGIVFCLHKGKRLAGALYVDDLENKTRYYLYAGSVEEAKKYSCGSALLCYLIFGAKAKGMERFDFFGVIPEGIKNHPYTGYSAFKRTFGGHDVNFSGTWELPINKTSHAVIRLGRLTAKAIKKFKN